MIQNLTLINYQGHQQSHIELSPGVNILVGETDSGKTSIIRALRCILFNELNGVEFINYQADEYVIEAIIDGKLIRRVRGKSKNSYWLENEEYKAFGVDAPPNVAELINLNDINIQTQWDSIYLMSKEYTPGKVATHFNKLAKLDVIDRANNAIKSDIRKLTSSLSLYRDELKSDRDELKTLSYLDDFEKDVEGHEYLKNQHKKIEKKIGDVFQIINKVSQLEIKLEIYPGIIKLETVSNSLLELFYLRKKQENDYDELRIIRDTYNIIQTDLNNEEKFNSVYARIEDQLILLNKRNQAEQISIQIEKLILSTTEKRNTENTLSKWISQSITLYKEKFPDTCPICGTSKQEIFIHND